MSFDSSEKLFPIGDCTGLVAAGDVCRLVTIPTIKPFCGELGARYHVPGTIIRGVMRDDEGIVIGVSNIGKVMYTIYWDAGDITTESENDIGTVTKVPVPCEVTYGTDQLTTDSFPVWRTFTPVTWVIPDCPFERGSKVFYKTCLTFGVVEDIRLSPRQWDGLLFLVHWGDNSNHYCVAHANELTSVQKEVPVTATPHCTRCGAAIEGDYLQFNTAFMCKTVGKKLERPEKNFCQTCWTSLNQWFDSSEPSMLDHAAI